MTDLWKVARINEQNVTPEQRAELFTWLRSLGLNPIEYRPTFAVTQDATDGSYRLHLTRFVLDAAGKKVIDYAAMEMHTEPAVVPITEFPAWLPAVSHLQGAP